jgi:cell division protein FtsL
MKKQPEKRELVNHTRQRAMLELGEGQKLFLISMVVAVVNQAEAEISLS